MLMLYVWLGMTATAADHMWEYFHDVERHFMEVAGL
jgi:hypothetical protein